MYCIYVHTDTTSWPRHAKLFLSSSCHANTDPPVTKIWRYGLLLGCRSELDAGPFEFFFNDFDPPKPGNLHCLF